MKTHIITDATTFANSRESWKAVETAATAILAEFGYSRVPASQKRMCSPEWQMGAAQPSANSIWAPASSHGVLVKFTRDHNVKGSDIVAGRIVDAFSAAGWVADYTVRGSGAVYFSVSWPNNPEAIKQRRIDTVVARCANAGVAVDVKHGTVTLTLDQLERLLGIEGAP